MPTHITASTGFLDLIAQAGPVAKAVLLLLLFASVLCWAIIFMKWRTLTKALKQNGAFLELFWHSKSIEEIFANTDKFAGSPVASVFKSGFKELKKLNAGELDAKDLGIENINRALAREVNSEIAFFERYVNWLATTASAAPFVGLFGTVWGIMNSFQNIGATGSANLAVVAPGISEALITTATGLAAAIPAVVAYNYFAGQIRRLAVDMENFSQDFLNIVHRSLAGVAARKGG